MQRAEHVTAFVLHRQAWQESGSIFELFTATHGRLSVFAQGVRGPRSRLAGVLQPFVPLLVSWVGRGEAPRLTGAEPHRAAAADEPLPAARLMSAWYCSELVMSLTARHDPQPELFACYGEALAGLRRAPAQEPVLRRFEKRMLDLLGYGLDDFDEAELDDAAGLARLRPLLAARMAQCLEGRTLHTRDVARAMKQFGRQRREPA